jgi:hypothetical protein
MRNIFVFMHGSRNKCLNQGQIAQDLDMRSRRCISDACDSTCSKNFVISQVGFKF